MADIQSQLPVKLTDGTNTAGITAGSAIKVDGSSVTQPVSGTITNVPSGTQAVSGTVTLSSQTVTLSSQTVTLSSQTVTTNADIAVTAGAASSKALLGGMQYNSTAPTLTTGQTVALQSDVNGNLKIAGSLTSVPSGTQAVTGTVTLSSQTVTLSSQTVTLSSQTVTIGATSVTQPVSGTVATNADATLTAGAAPSKALIGGLQYNSTAPTLTTGQTVALQGDINGNQKVVLTGSNTVTLSSQTVTLSSQTVTIGASTITQAVSGTVTNVPSGTQTVSGTVTLSSQTVTLSSQTVTLSSQTVTTNAESSIGAGTAPSKALVGGFVYNSTAPTLTTGQTAALQGDVNGNLKVVLQGTSTVTTVPSGTQSVNGTVTLTSQTVTIGASSITQAVSGTVTNVPSGTQTVAGTVTNVPSGTQTVSGTVTTSNLVTTGIVNSYITSSALANGSTATLSYTVTAGKTLYLKGVFASSSGAPCKVIVDYGAGPTVAAVGFYSTSSPFLSINFAQPISISATTVVNVKIQNNAGAAQDVYATIMGQEV